MIVRIGVAVAVVLATVAACTSDSSRPPTSLPSLNPSVHASLSPTATPMPTPPDEAYEHTPAGAEAFVRFYIELINNAYRTGDSEPLRHYATDECNSCSGTATTIDEIYAAGDRAVGGQLTAHDLTATGVAPGVQTSVVANTSLSPYRRMDSSGNVVSTNAADTRALIFDLTWIDESWRVKGIRDVQEQT